MLKSAFIAASLLFSAEALTADIALENPGFEKAKVGKRIPGWPFTQHAGVRAYEVSVDTDTREKGKSSIRIRRTTEQAYGMISQHVDVAGLAGKPFELIAALKTEDVGEKGWVMVLTFKNHSDMLDQVRAPIAGDTPWKDVTISKVAPIGTNRIEIGFMLLDGGTGWADNVRLRTVEDEKPDREADSETPEGGEPNTPFPRQVFAAADVSKDGQVKP